MKYWKQFNLLCCYGLLSLFWAVFPLVPGFAETVDRIIAKVNEKIITQSELEERAFMKMMSLQKANVQPMPSKEKVMYEELEFMIEERLLLDAARKLGIKVDEESMTKAVDEIKRTNGISDEDLEKMLRAESKTMEDYKNKIRDQILASRVVGYEVRKRVTVSDEEVEEYYNQHLKDYWVSEKLQLRHILFLIDDSLLEMDKIVKKQKALQALQKIRSGEDFNAVAKEYSEDISASTGGELGIIERGKMVPEFEKAAFQLKEGEVSGLVETPYGLHIIKVDKIIPGDTLPLDKVQNQIKNRLMDQKMKAEYQAYLLELKQKAFIVNKLPPPTQRVATNAKKNKPETTKKPALNQGNVIADIFSSKKQKDSGSLISQEQKFSKFQNFEDELRYYKKLRNNNKISEGEYQKKKRELLNRL